jgi:hypothetical protein
VKSSGAGVRGGGWAGAPVNLAPVVGAVARLWDERSEESGVKSSDAGVRGGGWAGAPVKLAPVVGAVARLWDERCEELEFNRVEPDGLVVASYA